MDNHEDKYSPNYGEREFEVGKDEAWFANIKRTYDEYQHESLHSIREKRTYISKTLSDASQNDNVRQNIANQALQNAVETANLVGKQAVNHRDISVDRQWNVDEVAQLVAKNGVMQDAISAAVTKAVQDALTRPSE